jgi:hypothetical protein
MYNVTQNNDIHINKHFDAQQIGTQHSGTRQYVVHQNATQLVDSKYTAVSIVALFK